MATAAPGPRPNCVLTPRCPTLCGVQREAYVEAVLRVVESIPPGQVMSYGAVAEVVGAGGPRQVGRVLALYGGAVPWWRGVRADGTLAACHEGAAGQRHRREGTALRSEHPLRVDMRAATWSPAP